MLAPGAKPELVAPYRFTRSARDDLLDIWLYTEATWGEEQADRYQDELHDCCARIAAGTANTRSVSGLSAVRVCHCRHHYLFFVERDDTVVIIAVLHERMDLLQRLKGRL